ncbi:tetratricopeptide repeat protein [Chryseobacterium tongliaoense]|uniref:tetratricopeptide repeat protein n=1 Tax=Chryseobacterium tongliaoense TaxID=3240933 RepID=UPI003510EB03
MSFELLNKAIAIDEKIGKKFFLPHLYHMKGKLYLNKGDCSNAMLYYDKALKNYNKKTELLYIASMHNNFAICYQKMNKLDLAIKECYTAIHILENKSYHPQTVLEKDFIYYVKGRLSKYLIEKKDFSMAEKLLNEALEFYKGVTGKLNKDYNIYTIEAAEDLFEIYTVTRQKEKQRQIISFLQELEPHLLYPIEKIKVKKVFLKYYAANSDIQNLKLTADKLVLLNDKYNEDINKELNKTSDLLSDYIIKSVNQKYDYEIRDKERKNIGLVIFIFLLTLIFLILGLSVRNRNKKEKVIAEKQRLILEANKKILEKNLQFNKEQVKNLQLSLHLKIETEKTFLENLKKIKTRKNINTEQILNNLLIKVNNLILIDKKNNDLLNESSFENKLFIERLSNNILF